MKATLTQKYFKLPVWLWATILLFAAGGATAYLMNQPRHAGWRYGACKVFLEQYIRFPTTIQVQTGSESRNSVAIGFSDINPFGSQQIRVFECFYSQGPKGTELSKITMDRKTLPDDLTKKFNAQLKLLAGQKLDTALPKDLPRSLEALKK